MLTKTNISPASREATSRNGLVGLLAERPVAHIEWGLQRIDAVLEALGRPERTFHSVHFAGTNGKGSTAAVAHSVLRAAGHRAALYTSPHLVELVERIQASGLTDELLDSCADRVRPLADAQGATYFEALTATAFLAFAELGVEWASVETGLGGRLDATNLVMPAACGIVSVSHDHESHLGSTLAEIAGEKAGILKSGIPVALGQLPREAERVIEAVADTVGVPLRRLGREAVVDHVHPELMGTRFRYRSISWPDGLDLRTPLVGAHQASNAAVALLALEAAIPELDEEHVRRGVGDVQLQGRFQPVDGPGGLWVLDMAHNPAGIRALQKTVEDVELPRPVAFVVGILGDKPWSKMLRHLLRSGERAVLTTAPSAPVSRRWKPEAAAREVPGIEAEPDFERALVRGRELAGVGTVLVTGSAYTVGDALTWLSRFRAQGNRDEENGYTNAQ